MKNRTLAVLAASATLVAGIGSSAIPSQAVSAAGTPSAASVQDSGWPTLAEAKSALVKETGTDRVAVVEGVGYSGDPMFWGAVVTARNTLAFYTNGGDGWGTSSDWAEHPLPATYDSQGIRPEGSLVDGVTYPVFVVRGEFTEDGTGRAIGFAHNIDTGWGVLHGAGDRLLPGGHLTSPPHLDGLEVDMYFQYGFLVTNSLWGPYGEAPVEEQTRNPIVRSWTGNADGFLTMRAEFGGPFD